MKVLVVIKKSPVQRFLVDLDNLKLVKEVGTLLGRGRHSQAIATALAKGRFEGEVTDSDLSKTHVDLILTEESVSWDLMRGRGKKKIGS